MSPVRRPPPALGLLAPFALLAGLLAAPAAADEARSVRLVLHRADLAAGVLEPGPSVLAGTPDDDPDSWLTSPVQDPGRTFSAVGPHWKSVPGTEIQVSVSPDGVRWGRWIAVPPDEPIEATREDGAPNPFAGETPGALVFVDPASRFLRCRARLPAGAAATDGPARISLHVIDPGSSVPGIPAGAPLRATRAPEPAPFLSGLEASVLPRRTLVPLPDFPIPVPGAAKPPILTRAQWGARPPRTSYTPTLARHIGIHHTATVEDWAAGSREECAARVRAIQTYHIDTQGWNDIGYAYVVCKHGDIFQAREDDDDSTDVQGAHDGFNRESTGISAFGYFHPPVDHHPAEAQLSAIVQLTAWIASRRAIDPLGTSLYAAYGSPVDNVYGHRQVGATACPGDHLFALLEALRAAARDRIQRRPR